MSTVNPDYFTPVIDEMMLLHAGTDGQILVTQAVTRLSAEDTKLVERTAAAMDEIRELLTELTSRMLSHPLAKENLLPCSVVDCMMSFLLGTSDGPSYYSTLIQTLVPIRVPKPVPPTPPTGATIFEKRQLRNRVRRRVKERGRLMEFHANMRRLHGMFEPYRTLKLQLAIRLTRDTTIPHWQAIDGNTTMMDRRAKTLLESARALRRSLNARG